MAQKSRTKSQHYVPQFYLRGFTNASNGLFCFDKVSEKSHPTSTKAAAQEPYFYEITPGSFEDLVVPVNTIEKALASVERKWAPVHADLIKNADAGTIPANLKQGYSFFVVFQWMRTRAYRDYLYEVDQSPMQSLVDVLARENCPGERMKLILEKEGLPAVHALELLNYEKIGERAHNLRSYCWVIGINNTKHLFYTSDHPVVRRGNRMLDGRPMVGIFDPGVEYVFPLDSRHILLILEREHFADWTKHENAAIALSPEQVLDYNALQVMRSNQRLFCAEDDFDVARDVCLAHPEVRDPDRSRVLVETTPIKDMKNYTFVTALE